MIAFIITAVKSMSACLRKQVSPRTSILIFILPYQRPLCSKDYNGEGAKKTMPHRERSHISLKRLLHTENKKDNNGKTH